jgi:hypothetical protein
LTTVVAVVLDWDERREALLRRVRSMGVAVRTFVVHEGPTRLPFEAMGDVLGPITGLTPGDVEGRLQAAEAAATGSARAGGASAAVRSAAAGAGS